MSEARETEPRPRAEREELFQQYLPLVRHVAHAYQWKLTQDYEFEDLVAIGQLAVWKATARWREDGGASFKTYAYQSLVHRYELLRRPYKAKRRVGFTVTSLDEPNDEGEPWRQVPSDEEPQDQRMEFARRQATLRAAYARLNPAQRHVLTERFLEERTLAAVGDDLNVSRERVRQIEKEALKKLRRLFPGAVTSAPVSSRQARSRTEGEVNRRQQYLTRRKVASSA